MCKYHLKIQETSKLIYMDFNVICYLYVIRWRWKLNTDPRKCVCNIYKLENKVDLYLELKGLKKNN